MYFYYIWHYNNILPGHQLTCWPEILPLNLHACHCIPTYIMATGSWKNLFFQARKFLKTKLGLVSFVIWGQTALQVLEFQLLKVIVTVWWCWKRYAAYLISYWIILSKTVATLQISKVSWKVLRKHTHRTRWFHTLALSGLMLTRTENSHQHITAQFHLFLLDVHSSVVTCISETSNTCII